MRILIRLVLLGLVAAGVAAALPDIKRYLEISRM